MDETSQIPRKELLHVHKVSDCARFAFEAGKANGSTVRFNLKLSFGMLLLSRVFGL
jgi:hypothetical protein